MKPDELLDQLKKKANKNKCRNLELINKICKDQHERGSKDFSIAMIGKLSEERKGIKAQSIRNKGGIDFRALIQCWAEHTGGSHVKVFEKKSNPLQDLLLKIERPDIRAVFSTVLAENKKLRGEIDIMRKLMNKGEIELIVDRRPNEIPSSTEQITVLPPINELTNSEIQSLQNSVSKHFFTEQGWEALDNGRVINSKGRSIYKAGYVTAINKVLSLIKK